KDEAVKTFQQLLADHPDSALKQDVEMRLVALHPAPAKGAGPRRCGPPGGGLDGSCAARSARRRPAAAPSISSTPPAPSTAMGSGCRSCPCAGAASWRRGGGVPSRGG